MLGRQKHVLSQSTTPFACTLIKKTHNISNSWDRRGDFGGFYSCVGNGASGKGVFAIVD